MSALIQSAVADMRDVLRVLHHLTKHNAVDRQDLVNALDMLTDSIDEIDQVTAPMPDLRGPDFTRTCRVPVMTLDQIVADARRPRPALQIIEGGRS